MSELNPILETTYRHWRRAPGKLAPDERDVLAARFAELVAECAPGDRLANKEAVEQELLRIEAKLFDGTL